jgi:hypothetical protein
MARSPCLQQEPHQKPGVNPVALEWQEVPVSNKDHTTNLERTQSRLNGKKPLPPTSTTPVGDRDFLPFKGDWVHSRILVWFLLETGTSCHSRATGFTPGIWCGPCWRQGLLAIQGRLGSLQVFGVVLVGDRDFLPFKGDWVHYRSLVWSLLETARSPCLQQGSHQKPVVNPVALEWQEVPVSNKDHTKYLE